MSLDFSLVTPINPVAAYLGGKSRLAKTIIPLIEQIPHITYAEPFIGMGGVFFRRKKRPKSEVINDFNQELIILFRVLQRHEKAFLDCLRFAVTSRAEFIRWQNIDPNTLTNIERAVRFYYLQKTAFGGKTKGQSYGVNPDRPARIDINKQRQYLELAHKRLSSVNIENKPYGDFIRIYDRAETLFYLDPPYWGHENDYGKDCFYRDDFTKLRDQLSTIKGKFIMSLNNSPEIQSHFAQFFIKEVATTYSIDKSNSHPASELLISNVVFNL